jgi:pimeloyl-ACP methyl ester carboxylesterase
MQKTIIHKSLTVFYRTEYGEGQTLPDIPLVLLHGFAEDGWIWDQQVEYLKKNHRLIIPDLPGSGRSSLLPAETSVEELADFINAILDAEKTEKCVLVGHSMGGYITLAFAEKYPLRLKAFGLFHSTAYSDSEEKKKARRKSIELIRNYGVPAFIRQSTPNLFSENFRRLHPEIIEGLINRYANFHPDMPGLAYIHILENAGHMGMLEESARTNLLLDEFLQQVR